MRTIIVAVNPDRVIGKGNDLPWHYRPDLRRFKRLTLGGVLIMGRRTWESLPIKPLPGRLNLIITSRSAGELDLPEGAHACPGLEGALATADKLAPGRPVWFMGGARLYQEALELADAIDMTHVPEVVEPAADLVYFPELSVDEWEAGPIEVDEVDPRLKRQVYRRKLTG